MRLIFDLSFSELVSLFQTWKEPDYRADQVWQGLYHQFWDSPAQFTQLPALLRARLAEEFSFEALQPLKVIESSDRQTIKTLFALSDGKAIEAVLMKYDHRQTVCVSTQVGCALGCVFCATGQMGFTRHLTSGEIVAQVMNYARILHAQGKVLTNVVVMGMGEPFHNYANTLAAIDRLNSPEGLNFGARRFTISSVGLVPAIRQFTAERRQINLAISLHASDNTLRASMLPIAKVFPLNELIDACRDYVKITGRRITFEWALIHELNDGLEQAYSLADLLKGMLCHVNAIPLNPTSGYQGQATRHEKAEKFQKALINKGIPCTLRLRRGIDIKAGCGQLIS